MTDADEAFYRLAGLQRDAAWAENARLREALRSLCRVGLDCLRDGSTEHRHRLIEAVEWGQGVLSNTAAEQGAVSRTAPGDTLGPVNDP